MDDFYFESEENQSETKIDIKRYWRILINKWWLWSIITIVVSIPWVIYVKQEKPLYEAKAVIQFRNYEAVDFNLLESRRQELTSRSFAERVVGELGLVLEIMAQDNEPIYRRDVFESFTTTKYPENGTYAIRFPGDGTFTLFQIREGDAANHEIKIISGSIATAQNDTVFVRGFGFMLSSDRSDFPREVIFKIHGFRDTVKSFQSRIGVDYGRTGTLMEVKMQDTDPYLVALMTNKLANIFARESASLKTRQAENELNILKSQLDRAKKDLDESNLELKNFQQANSLTIDGTAELQAKELSKAETDRENLKQTQTILVSLLNQVHVTQQNNDKTDTEAVDREIRAIFHEIVKVKIFDGDPNMAIAKGRLQDFESSYDQRVKETSPENPLAIDLAGKIKEVQDQIERLVREKITDIDRQTAKLGNKVNELTAKIAQQPAKRIEYTALVRKNDNLAKIYQDFLSRYQNAQILAGVETEEINILDPAIQPELPINGNKKSKAALGLVFSFFLGLTVTLSLEFFDKTLKSVDDVKKHLRLSVLGTIPEIKFDDVIDFQDQEKRKMIDNQLVTHDYSPTPIGEAYRSLRTSIMFSKTAGRIQTLVVTSMAPGDGKSFTAANLAITLAQQKSNTLLIDTDLRRGVLHNTFGLQKEPGFSNYLTSSIPVSEIISETHIPNLSLISCGSLIPNPSELLGSHQMHRFLDEVRRKFDIVIFDTPPLNAATDAIVVGTQVDATVIVVRAGKTHRDVARQKLELYQHVPARVLGVVLNATSTDLAHEGYSYYHY